jgi:hypothetical protein
MYIATSGFRRAAALTLLFVGACGELADKDTKPPALMTVRGSLRLASSTTAPEGSVRLALVWHDPDYEDPHRQCIEQSDENRSDTRALASTPMERRFFLGTVQQAVDITPRFPSAFTLELTAPPPPEAIWEEEDGLQKAEGTLVVYRDGNGNGKLDPTTDSAASPDEVLSNDLQHSHGLSSEDSNASGQTWGYEVWYLDRPRKYSDMLDLHSGFNVLEYQSYGARVATEIALELLPTAELQAQLCANECVLQTYANECPASAADLPAAPAGATSGFAQSGRAWVWENGADGFGYQAQLCIVGRGGYSYSWSRTIADGCSERQFAWCHYGPTPEPAPDWPCEAFLDLETRTYVSP